MTDSDHFVIPRHAWRPLRDLLNQIPAVLDDLAVTVTRQDRIGSGSLGSSGDPTIPLPINLAASDAADDLHGELGIWVKHTARHRGLDLPRVPGTTALARWLNRHLIDLAQTPESDMAHDRIERCIRNCRRACDRPAEKRFTMDQDKLAEARALELNTNAIATIAKIMHVPHLTVKRINNLKTGGHITPARHAYGRDHYHLGDVLDAHRRIECGQCDTARTG